MGKLLYLAKGDKKMLVKRMERFKKKRNEEKFSLAEASTSKTLSKVI